MVTYIITITGVKWVDLTRPEPDKALYDRVHSGSNYAYRVYHVNPIAPISYRVGLGLIFKCYRIQPGNT